MSLTYPAVSTNVLPVSNATRSVRADAPIAGFEYVFPAIRGVQAGREYYVSMCPLRLLPKIFLFDEEELVPELRAQRTLNKGRLPALVRYILDNPEDYVFSAITASVDAEMSFEAQGHGGSLEDGRLGLLRIPMSARFLINDGQHRRAAIELALRENPDLADESIAVVFFYDQGLARCQQMFADLNRHAVRPSKAIGVLYDHRDDRAELVRLVVLRSDVFRNMVEMERSTLSARSSKLFTLSALYGATGALLQGLELEDRDEACTLAIQFWEAVAELVPEWLAVRHRRLTAADLRQNYLHSHGTALQALGKVGNSLLRENKNRCVWAPRLAPLAELDWSRQNKHWEGRALIGGRVSKSAQNVTLTVNAIKNQLGLALAPEEQRLEDAYTSKESLA